MNCRELVSGANCEGLTSREAIVRRPTTLLVALLREAQHSQHTLSRFCMHLNGVSIDQSKHRSTNGRLEVEADDLRPRSSRAQRFKYLTDCIDTKVDATSSLTVVFQLQYPRRRYPSEIVQLAHENSQGSPEDIFSLSHCRWYDHEPVVQLMTDTQIR